MEKLHDGIKVIPNDKDQFFDFTSESGNQMITEYYGMSKEVI